MASLRDRGTGFQVRHAGRSRTFKYHSKEERRQAKKDAEKWAFEQERKQALGAMYEAPAEVFGPFLDAFIARKKVKPRTIEHNKEVAHYLKPLRTLPVTSVKVAEVEDLIAEVAAKTPASAVKALALLKSALRAARRRGHAIDEAILEIAPPRHEVREARFLTLPELYELSSWLPDYIRHIVPIAGLTGMRQGELFDLEVDDLNLAEARLQVQKGKTPAARRTVYLSDEGVQLFKSQLLARAPGVSLVFPSRRGLRWEKSRFMARYYRPACISAGFGKRDEKGHYEGLTFHQLRHTAISLMAVAGWRPEHIARQVGHKDGGALIHKKYRHLYEQEMEALPAKLDALMEAR